MNIRYRFITLLCAAAAIITVAAQAPAGYYATLTGKSGAELKKALHNVIYNHNQVSSYSALPEYFEKTDLYPESRRWWDMYSDIPLYSPSFSGLNREHSFPKSWWGGSTDIPAYVDLYHLYPAEADANQKKSNYPLGTVGTAKFDNGVSKVGYPVNGQGGGASQVFEPDDEYKGDFARTYFYMVTCYSNLTWNTRYMWMLQQNDYPTLTSWAVNLLLKWHREDPVSDKETNRNEAVYRIQNNRNPFIDHPELVEYIWGDSKSRPYPGTGAPVGDPSLLTPVQDTALDLGQVAIGNAVTGKMLFRGENLTSPLRLRVYEGDTGMFSIASESIAAALVNAEGGYWLTVTYRPTALGTHSARMVISGGGITGTIGVVLRGECLEKPVLTAPVATAPSDITSTSYTANWNLPPDGETVDYYEVNRTRYIGGSASSETLLAEENSLEIDDFGGSDSETYSVRSCRLGEYSPWSNVITVSHAGISGVETDNAGLAVRVEGCSVTFVTSGIIHPAPRIFDMTGRLVRSPDSIADGDQLNLAPGCYMVVTALHPSPVRFIVR